MYITCDKKDFVSALKIASRAVSNKSTVDMLKNVLINASSSGEVEIAANNMELAISTMMDAHVLETGSIAIEAKTLGDIVNKLPNGEISLETPSTGQVNIRSGSVKFTIAGQDPEGFNGLPAENNGVKIKVSAEDFCYAVSKTAFCASPKNDANPMMTGVFVKTKGNEMSFTAVDNHRIAIRKIFLDDEYPEVKAIIPAQTLSEVSKILTSGDVEVSFESNNVIFRFDSTLANSRVISGEYFKIDQILNVNPETRITVDGRRVLDAASRTTVFPSERKPMIATISDEVMNFELKTTLGGVSEDIGISKEGQDIRIGLNPRFVIDAVAAADDDEITMYFINPKSPVTIKNDDETYCYVILPVNI